MTHHQVAPGVKSGKSTLTVMGPDLTRAMNYIGAGYLIYRGIRMLPSIVFPPLWPTALPNAAIP